MAVAITTDLGGITNFDIHGDPTTVGARWKKWKRSFELFVVGKGVQDAAQKKALLLHCGGPQMQDVYYTFPEAREPGEGETVYTVAMEQLDQYFMPQVNIPNERHLFRTMAQARFKRRSIHAPNLTDELSTAEERYLNQFGSAD